MSENRLGRETSPYLIQHKANPVHWWPWGPAALAEARRTGKPILLSVGYAACHWCHVMAHESFEDDATAAVMNDLFVNIKVDREERPDIDAIYMGALHRLGQQGGWPLTMFLDSDARPFWGGTYFPKHGAYGRPAFVDVLHRVATVYRKEPDKIASNAEALVASLAAIEDDHPGAAISDGLLREVTTRLARAVDPVHGGITGAPKFPQTSFFWMLWRGAIRYGDKQARAAVTKTLEQISQGGIYDHLGGGFARYAVDELWLVPHFEKMLYDNALLIDLMTEVWRETKSPLLATRIEETIAWLEREMMAEEGGFASSLDADSEGEEGKFYVWTPAEIEHVLGAEDAAFFAKIYDVTPGGNFEGHTILNRLANPALLSDEDEHRLAALRGKLLEARAGRIRPGWDDKVLADWNGLMIAALARAGRVFDRSPWVTLAEKAFTFVSETMTVDSRLVHAWRSGRASAPATASDYANMIFAAIRLFEATSEERYLASARHWTKVLDEHYWLTDGGGYAMSADDTSDVIVRMRSASDDATPSANAMMVRNLMSLSLLTGEQRYEHRAQDILEVFSANVARTLSGHTGLLAAALDVLAPQLVVTVGGEHTGAVPQAAIALSLPGAIQIHLHDGNHDAVQNVPALRGKDLIQGAPAAYVCAGPQCSAPLTDPKAVHDALLQLRSSA